MKELFLVTDTHPLLWYIGKDDSKLSKKVIDAFESAERGVGTYIWVPAAVVWEISLLMRRTERVTALAPLEEIVKDNFYSRSISVMELQTEDILRAHRLGFNNDPFDALIVATAQRLDLPLITADGAITKAKPCAIFWD